jgi:2-haloacid dehalogenase
MASTLDILKRETRTLVFDQYGTIVDMQGGLVAAAKPFLEKKGWTGDPNQFVTWWRRTHYEDSMIDALLDRGHTPYRQIGHRAVSQVLDRCKLPHTQGEVEWLVSQIESLKPFPDVVAALEKLRTRYKLVILSNGDRDMLEAAKPHIGFPMDLTVSVQEAGYFKPHWKTYATAERLITERWPNIERSGCLFVANHAFDCIGAKSHGFRAAFVDRRKRPYGQSPNQPDIIVADFKELAEVLTSD